MFFVAVVVLCFFIVYSRLNVLPTQDLVAYLNLSHKVTTS